MKGYVVYSPNGGTVNGSPLPTAKSKPQKATKSGALRARRKTKRDRADKRMADAAAELQKVLG